MKRKVTVLLTVLIISLTTCVEAASWVHVVRDSDKKADWFLEKNGVSYKNSFLYFIARAEYDNIELNGYKHMIVAYKIQQVNPPKANVIKIGFFDDKGNLIDEGYGAEDVWFDWHPGSVGYLLIKEAEKHVK